MSDGASIGLGSLPFSISSAELKVRSSALLDSARRRVEEIAGPSTPRDLSHFLEPLDRLFVQVRDLSYHGSFLFSIHPDESVRTAGREASEAAERFFSALRVRQDVYRALGELPIPRDDPETAFAVEQMRREMRRAGVEQSEGERQKLVALSDEIDRISNEYAERIAKSQRSIEVEGAHALDGLPADYRAQHPPNAEGKIRVTTDYPDFRPVMTYCANAEIRRRLLEEFTLRAFPENVAVLSRLLEKRHEFATRLGYANYAAYALEDKMMKTPEAAEQFLARVGALLRPRTEADLARLLARKRRDDPSASRIENWDFGLFAEGFYEARIRSEEFGVDPKLLRRFLPYGLVRDGLFSLCGTLFGLTFHRGSSEGLWHPTVEVYEVRLHGRPLGRCYFDMVPREGKYSHAACFSVREGIEGLQLPQSALVCNFLDPGVPAESARMEHGDVVTFFHEFGHLLHALLSGHARWSYNSQGGIEWDFVEAPSQLFEEWARDPATLGRFARDPDTGETIPTDLLAKLERSTAVGRASRWTRQVALSEASLALYDRDPSGLDPERSLKEAYARYSLVPLDDAYHFEAAWGHLTGYSAFYYTYVWSLVIARDLLSPFLTQRNLTDPEIARRYAEHILSAGSRRPAAELITSYLGRPFDFRAFERWVSESA